MSREARSLKPRVAAPKCPAVCALDKYLRYWTENPRGCWKPVCLSPSVETIGRERERERGGVSKNSNKTIIKTSACARTVPEGGKRQHHHRSVRKALKYVQMEPNMSTEASQDRKMIAVPYKRDRGPERNQDLPSRRFNPDTVRIPLSDGTGNPGGERNYIYLSIKIMDL